MEINGLPLHPLIVHAAVVFGPLAALSALVYVGLPRHRDVLRWVTAALVLIGFVSIWAAWFSGNSFYGEDRFAHVSGTLKEHIDHHKALAGVLRWVTTGFALVTAIALWQHHRVGTARHVLGALVVVGALATLVWTALTGDAGARSVWGS